MVAGFEIMIGFVLLVLALVSAFYLFTIYNGFVELRNNIDKAWANIDVLLKQRSDLIPNLVKAVREYMKHEREVLEKITELRIEVLKDQDLPGKAEASTEISRDLKTIFAVAEGYPELQASRNFLDLQKQLALIEDKIADRREFYNQSVALYNERRRTMPDLIIAELMGLKDMEYFLTKDEEREVPDIEAEG